MLCIFSLRFYKVDEKLQYLDFTFPTLHMLLHLTNLSFMKQIWCALKNYSEIFGVFHLPNNFPANLIRQNLVEFSLCLRGQIRDLNFATKRNIRNMLAYYHVVLCQKYQEFKKINSTQIATFSSNHSGSPSSFAQYSLGCKPARKCNDWYGMNFLQ